MNPILCADSVSYRYINNGHGLDAVSLQVQPGEMVLLSGPSGCGKSTLARCLAGLIPHLYRGELGGEVRVDGLRTVDAPLWQLSERVGLVFQNPAAQMLASTVENEIVFGLENLGQSSTDIRTRLEAALAQFDLAPLRLRSPLTLSGGEQQKLALAATMVRRPPVLVLDEPLSMLDSTAVEQLVAHLDALARQGTAVIVCEHRAEALRSLEGLRIVELGNRPGAAYPARESAFPGPGVASFSLRVSGLSVRLGGRPVLRDLNFELDGRQIVAIVGRNGVGKTTLLRALAGLQGHSGEIDIAGERPDLALVFQNPDLQLFNPTVRDEILYKIKNPDLARYHWLLDALGLCPYEDTPPLLLSEGEKKRVALATALMRMPQHGILLDEPSLGQDTAHKVRLIALARSLVETGRLVLMTTHDLSLAAQADRLLLLGQEGLVADGCPAAILADEAAWCRIGLRVPEWIREMG
ncbi:MAG: ABC transporter ATP-binding protein [Anaerolineae bacterium]|nr:ABC transporter ATP-binding protein [Anaerolineae bacterium]